MEDLKMGLTSIGLNKGRSFLTMLGIVIGVAAVVLVFAITEGVRRDVTASIEGLGSNILFLVPGKVRPGQLVNAGSFSTVLTRKDLKTVRSIRGVKSVSPLIIISNVTVAGRRSDPMATNIGVGEKTPEMMNLKLDKGRFFTKEEVERNESVAVLGAGPNAVLFPGQNAVGKAISIKGKAFKVVGVLRGAPSTSSLGGANFDSMVMIPYTTSAKLLGSAIISRIALTADNQNEVGEVKKKVTAAVKRNHGGVEDFSVLAQEDILSTAERILGAFSSMIASIAAISVVVGGIGIMNMMLVSVTERTREIGIRKAVGATSGDILLQFMIEAVALSFIGGAMGVALALLGSRIIDAYSDRLQPYVSVSALVLALVMAFLVGVVFGIAPAFRAAKMSPIEALRRE